MAHDVCTDWLALFIEHQLAQALKWKSERDGTKPVFIKHEPSIKKEVGLVEEDNNKFEDDGSNLRIHFNDNKDCLLRMVSANCHSRKTLRMRAEANSTHSACPRARSLNAYSLTLRRR